MRTLPERRRAGQGPPRLPVRWLARDRQDQHGQDPRRLPELRRKGRPSTPCGDCDSCVSIANATSLDVIEMDAASNNSVDDIRDLREKVAYAPVSGRHKVYILDEAHMLSPQAWNAFLKTLEEPPPRTIFVLATTEAQKVLPTVVDRCHRFDFGRPSVDQVRDVLQRVAAAGADRDRDGRGGADRSPRHRQLPRRARHARAARHLRRRAGGSSPPTCSRCSGSPTPSSCSTPSTRSIARDPRAALRAAAKLADSGRDPGQVLRDLEVHGRELLTVQVLGEVPAELRVTPERDGRLAEQASALADTDAVRLLDLVSAALEATANGAQARIQLELVLVKAAAPELDPSTAALLARIERLEAGPGADRQRRRSASAPRHPPQPSRRLPQPSRRPRRQNRRQNRRRALAAPRPRLPCTQPDPPPEPPLPRARRRHSCWPAVVDLVRGENAMLAALLADARPVAVEERELTLAFPGGAAFLKRKAEQDDYRRVAGEALKAVTGRRLVLRYELATTRRSRRGEAVLSGEELVRRFVEEFDAEEILEDEPEEGEARADAPTRTCSNCSSRPRRCSRTCWPRRSRSRTRSWRPRPAAAWSRSR